MAIGGIPSLNPDVAGVISGMAPMSKARAGVAPSTDASRPAGTGGSRTPALPAEQQRPIGRRRGRGPGPAPPGGHLRRACRLRAPGRGRWRRRAALRSRLVALRAACGPAHDRRTARALGGGRVRHRSGAASLLQERRAVAWGRGSWCPRWSSLSDRPWCGTTRPASAGSRAPTDPFERLMTGRLSVLPGRRRGRPDRRRSRHAGLRGQALLGPTVGGRAGPGLGRGRPRGRSLHRPPPGGGAVGRAGADPHRGTGRDGGAPPRFRPADAGPHAAGRRRSAADGPPGPPPGA